MSLTSRFRYLCEYAVALIFWHFFRLLPIDTASCLGGRIAVYLAVLLPAQKTAMRNLAKCMPQLTTSERKKITTQMWDNIGRIIGELPHWHNMSDYNFAKRVQLSLPADFDGSLNALRGNFCLSAHYGNWEIYCKLYQFFGLDISLLYRPANNPLVDKLINKQRMLPKINLIKKGTNGIRQILKALHENKCVGMLVDQKTDDGITVPFMGIAAKTTAAPANIALKYKKHIILSRIIRTNGANYKVEFCAPLKIMPNDDAISIMTKVNEQLEQWIKEYPEQWFWVHNRWGKL